MKITKRQLKGLIREVIEEEKNKFNRVSVIEESVNVSIPILIKKVKRALNEIDKANDDDATVLLDEYIEEIAYTLRDSILGINELADKIVSLGDAEDVGEAIEQLMFSPIIEKITKQVENIIGEVFDELSVGDSIQAGQLLKKAIGYLKENKDNVWAEYI